jgi:hypothetical protein
MLSTRQVDVKAIAVLFFTPFTAFFTALSWTWLAARDAGAVGRNPTTMGAVSFSVPRQYESEGRRVRSRRGREARSELAPGAKRVTTNLRAFTSRLRYGDASSGAAFAKARDT